MTTFHDQINMIFAELRISNNELAEACELDCGFLSKLKTGERTPVKDGPTIGKISKGFFKVIVKYKKEFMFADLFTQGRTLEERIYNYFNEHLPQAKKVGRRPNSEKPKIIPIKEEPDCIQEIRKN